MLRSSVSLTKDEGNLALGKPSINAQLLLANERHLKVEMLEVTLQSAARTLHANRAALDLDGNCVDIELQKVRASKPPSGMFTYSVVNKVFIF